MNFWYWLGHSAAKLVARTRLSYRVQNGEALDSLEGGLLVVSNHVSFLDPPLVGIAFRKPIYFFARKTLFDHPVANFIFTRVNAIPVDQAKPELSSLKKVIALLKGDETVLIFPEGQRSRNGKLRMEGQAGVGMIVSKARVPILPVRLFGPDKALARGEKKIRKHPVTLVVGELLRPEDLVDESVPPRERYKFIANRVMEEIAKLELKDDRGE
ncbi:MAG: lysophospholipid acyltransferase family protein [Verrucomicrobiales bacterium]